MEAEVTRKRKSINLTTVVSSFLFYCIWWITIIVSSIRERSIGYTEAGFVLAGVTLPTLSFMTLSGEIVAVRILSAIGIHCLIGKLILYRYP